MTVKLYARQYEHILSNRQLTVCALTINNVRYWKFSRFLYSDPSATFSITVLLLGTFREAIFIFLCAWPYISFVCRFPVVHGVEEIGSCLRHFVKRYKVWNFKTTLFFHFSNVPSRLFSCTCMSSIKYKRVVVDMLDLNTNCNNMVV